jgi:tetrahydromethanopterin S-methyltransferase subunit G
MQALSDEQQFERLENKVDRVETSLGQRIDRVETELGKRIDRVESKLENGFAEMRSESRADFRLLLGAQLTMLAAMILGFAGILLQHL